MMTLLKVTSGGEDWGPYMDTIADTSFTNRVMFIFYILFFIISVWNIVTSIFVDKAMQLAMPGPLEKIANQRRADLQDAFELEMMVREKLSVDENQNVTIAELTAMMNDEHG